MNILGRLFAAGMPQEHRTSGFWRKKKAAIGNMSPILNPVGYGPIDRGSFRPRVR